MTSFVAIVALITMAVCICPSVRSLPSPQTVTTAPVPQTKGATAEGPGAQIGIFVDQMVQYGKDTIKKFIPQGGQGAPTAIPRVGGDGVPVSAVHHLAAGFVGVEEKAHGLEGHVHNAACRNVTA